MTGRTDDDEIAGTRGGDVDEARCHGIGEMDRGRRADGLRNEVVRFGQPLFGLVEAEFLVLPFGFRRCLLRRGSAEDMDEVEFDRVGRQCRLSQGEGERDRVTSASVHGDADDVAHEVSFDSNRSAAGEADVLTIGQSDERGQRGLRG